MKRFKKRILILAIFITMISVNVFSEINSFSGFEFGYGNETGGVGVAAEYKKNTFGISVGAGMFSGQVTYNLGFKLYHDYSSTNSVYLGFNYGVLGSEWKTGDIDDTIIYGPSISGGLVYLSKSGLYLNGALGYGWSDTNYWGMVRFPTVQLSIGFAFDN